jgi:hypothetical protein
MIYTSDHLYELAEKLKSIAHQFEMYDDELAGANRRAEVAEADARRMGEENSRLCDENYELERKLKEASCVPSR